MTGWTPFQLARGHWEIRRRIDSCRNGGAATAQRNSGHWESIELVRDLLVPRNSEQAQEQAQPKLSSDTDAFSYPVSSSAAYTSPYALICQSSTRMDMVGCAHKMPVQANERWTPPWWFAWWCIYKVIQHYIID